MEKYEKLNEKIGELQLTNFNYQKNLCYQEMSVTDILRASLLYYNQICRLENESQEKELYQNLDMMMSNKIKELNPNFDENIIKNILNCYQRGTRYYPIDIFVVSNAVFLKQGQINNRGNLYNVKTFMSESTGNYYNVFTDRFAYKHDGWRNTLKELDCGITEAESMHTSKFISDSINEMLMSEYGVPVTKPIYELNKNGLFYGVQGLTYGDIYGINIYMNKKFIDIAQSMKNKQECDIEMYVQMEDEISLYKIHQSFQNDKIVWHGEKLDLPVWRLSEEAMKKEIEETSKQKVKK